LEVRFLSGPPLLVESGVMVPGIVYDKHGSSVRSPTDRLQLLEKVPASLPVEPTGLPFEHK
jgi:hypothetical protein